MSKYSQEQYQQSLEYIYNRLQAFHNVGAAAYKPGLDKTLSLLDRFGNPHRRLRTVHVAGTNGKGSTSHLIAAVLQSAGYRTGLYTSPHLVDFAERIRVDGQPIDHDSVVDFVERFKAMPNEDGSVDPSFFELATVMAFEYFERCRVDIAVVEVGLGGRLDSTNVILPQCSVITNISLDHTALLGNTLAAVAAEKGGIIKPHVPVVIGERSAETDAVFEAKAVEVEAPLIYAQALPLMKSYAVHNDHNSYDTVFGHLTCPLTGELQVHNARTVLAAINVLRTAGSEIADASVQKGFAEVCALTGLMGRWMPVGPHMVCDTGHNAGAWQYLGPRLQAYGGSVVMVLGFVADKDLEHIFQYMPQRAQYIFVQPSTPRAASAQHVAEVAARHGLHGQAYSTVQEGVEAARRLNPELVFVGGSTFVVADLLSHPQLT